MSNRKLSGDGRTVLLCGSCFLIDRDDITLEYQLLFAGCNGSKESLGGIPFQQGESCDPQ